MMTVMSRFQTLKGFDLVGYGLLLGTFYYIGLVIWRLFFHPLSKFPGPRLAAASRWYEFYHDVILGGVTPKRYSALHKRYGMHRLLRSYTAGVLYSLRANQLLRPDSPYRARNSTYRRSELLQRVCFGSGARVQVNSQFGRLIYHRLYSWHSEYYKAPSFYEAIGISNSLVSICDPEKHKTHRSVVTPLFAKQSIDGLAPSVAGKVEDAVEVMKHCHAQGKPVDIQLLYRCITVSDLSVVRQRDDPRSSGDGGSFHA